MQVREYYVLGRLVNTSKVTQSTHQPLLILFLSYTGRILGQRLKYSLPVFTDQIPHSAAEKLT